MQFYSTQEKKNRNEYHDPSWASKWRQARAAYNLTAISEPIV
jgi:hypothetical protein